jgi:Reverse transcriptase (RNA-dependent DNA polymerase)
MTLVINFDLKLHQMDVETVFFNGDIDEYIYISQPPNYDSDDSKQIVYKFKKSIYRLKQASRQWYFKFHQVIISFGFKPNLVDECIYHKFSESKFIFLILYVDDILFANKDKNMMREIKKN